MDLPASPKRCLAIVMLRVVGLNQKEAARFAKCANQIVGKVEKWFREEEDYHRVARICGDQSIKKMVAAEAVYWGVEEETLVKLDRLTQDDILLHYRTDYMKAGEPDIESVAKELKAQLFVPEPETVPETLLTHDFTGLGPHKFSLREDDFKAIWRNVGYDIREFKVYKESSGILSGDVKIDVVISDYGNLELYCQAQEHSLFEKLLSALPGGKEQLDELRLDVGKYLARCRRIYAEIHREAMEGTWQSPYEGVAGLHHGLQNWPPPLTPSFADLVYRLSIVYHQTSCDYGLPDKSLYQISSVTGCVPPFSGLYLGEINLGNSPDRPFLLPHFIKWVDMLGDLKDRHRNMIMKWSASPAIRELLELFNYCLNAAKALKLDDIIRGK